MLEFVKAVNEWMWGLILLIILCGTGIFFTIRLKFIQVRKFGEPDAENYTLVFDGDLGTSDLERIYTICRDAPAPGYQGYRMALSDVGVLYDDSGSEFYYCDRVGFQPIRFEQKQEPCINMTL